MGYLQKVIGASAGILKNVAKEKSGLHSIYHTTVFLILIGTFIFFPYFSAHAATNFTIAIDVNVSKDQAATGTTIVSPSFSTVAGNELLLAFVSADGPSGSAMTVSSVSGAGLTWTRVVSTNAQLGTSEIWRAFSASTLSNATVTATLAQRFSASLTVMSFSGVDTTGTNGSGAIGATGTNNASSGAPTASLLTTRNGSWVFGVGNDWDSAIARTPASGQTILHQYLPSVGDTYWVQEQNSATANSGTTVAITKSEPDYSTCQSTMAGPCLVVKMFVSSSQLTF
jgi:hypothetical protein